jgi:putative ATP-binding cassette transporter
MAADPGAPAHLPPGICLFMKIDVPPNPTKPSLDNAPPGPAATAGLAEEAKIAEGRNEAREIRREAEKSARRAVKGESPEAAAALEGSGEAAVPQFGFLRELRLLISGMLRGRKGWPILRLAFGILVVIIANMFGQVRLNQWNGAFFDAVEKKDVDGFLQQLVVFLMIVAVLLVLVVAQTWLQEMFKIRIRERLTQVLLDAWLKSGRAYQLGFAGQGGVAPDQRMQDDSRIVSEYTADIGVGVLNSTLLLISFIGVLWSLSAQVTFTILGRAVEIPGYMVWIAIGYALLGSGFTWLVGRPLIRLNTERYAREAELRFALVRVNESAESIALIGGEGDERRNLDGTLGNVIRALRRVSGALARLTWITSGYGWLAIVVPIIAAAPGYFSGNLSFGGLMMVVGAFTQVQQALRYFVENFARIADWRAAVQRVATFYRTVEGLEQATHDLAHIRIEPHPEGKLAFEGLSVALADGSSVIEEATAEVSPGERVLIRGESGSGKSTLFRAIAGLWPWGSGVIRVPPPEQQMFMPQRPYLPLGTLRAALCYPAAPDHFDDALVRSALERCQLGEFVGDLDRHERWDKALSLGQQQRIAFARLVLHKPRWVFMDEATSALDEDNEAAMLSLFDQELAGATVLSIGHRTALEAFHNRALQIRKTPHGAVLLSRRLREVVRPAPEPWRQRLRQWTERRRLRA